MHGCDGVRCVHIPWPPFNASKVARPRRLTPRLLKIVKKPGEVKGPMCAPERCSSTPSCNTHQTITHAARRGTLLTSSRVHLEEELLRHAAGVVGDVEVVRDVRPQRALK